MSAKSSFWPSVCLAAGLLTACGLEPVADGGVDASSPDAGGHDAGPSNDTCATAIVVGAGTVEGTTLGARRDYGPECTGYVNAGEDVVYAVSVPPGQRLLLRAIAVDETAAAFDPALYLIEGPPSSCDASLADGGSNIVCLAGADDSDAFAESLEWLNDAIEARTVYAVVDSYRARAQPGVDGGPGKATAGAFILEVSFGALAAAEACFSAAPLTPGVTATAQSLVNFSDEYDETSTCAGSSGADRAFKVSVPGGNVATVTVTPQQSLDAVVSATTSSAACGVSCVANADSAANGGAETLSWRNTGTAAADLWVVVDAWGTTTGAFSIIATMSTPGPDDLCEGATALVANAPLLAQSTVGFGNDYSLQAASTGCATTGFNGPDRAYSFVVPSMQRARITATPAADAGFDLSLNLLESSLAMCSVRPRVCSTGTNLTGEVAETVAVFNREAGDRTFFAIVDSTRPTGGAFDLALTLDTPPTDDTCSTATSELTDGGRADSLAGFSADYGVVGAGCFPFAGPDRVYRARLAAGEKLTATITPTPDGGFDPVVGFIVGPDSLCEALPRTCAGGIDFTVANQEETGGYVNATAAAVDLFVVVGDYERDSSSRDYTLTTTIGPPPAGESCEVPVRVTASQTFTAQSLFGASPDVTYAVTATTCIDTKNLPDAVYEVEVPAGRTLVAVATPQAGTNVALNLIEGACREVNQCLGTANAGAAGAVERLQWANTDPATKTVKLVVIGVPPGTYSLQLMLQ